MGWGNKWNWNGTSGFEKQNHRYFTVCCIASIELHNSSDRAESFDNLSEDKKMSRKIETFYSRITAKYFSKIFAQKTFTQLQRSHTHGATNGKIPKSTNSTVDLEARVECSYAGEAFECSFYFFKSAYFGFYFLKNEILHTSMKSSSISIF